MCDSTDFDICDRLCCSIFCTVLFFTSSLIVACTALLGLYNEPEYLLAPLCFIIITFVLCSCNILLTLSSDCRKNRKDRDLFTCC